MFSPSDDIRPDLERMEFLVTETQSLSYCHKRDYGAVCRAAIGLTKSHMHVKTRFTADEHKILAVRPPPSISESNEHNFDWTSSMSSASSGHCGSASPRAFAQKGN